MLRRTRATKEATFGTIGNGGSGFADAVQSVVATARGITKPVQLSHLEEQEPQNKEMQA